MVVPQFIRTLLTPPGFSDEAENRRAKILSIVARAILIGLLTLFVVRLEYGETVAGLFIIACAIFVFASLLLLQYKRLTAASYVLLVPILGIMIALALVNDGVHDSALYALSGILIVAGFLLKKSHSYAFSVVGLLLIAIIITLEYSGTIRTPYNPIRSLPDGVDIIIIIAITVIGVRSLAEQMFTDLQRAQEGEDILSMYEQRYRTMVENVNQAYYEADDKSLFTYCNPGFTALGGYSTEELLGTSAFRIIMEEDRPLVVESYKRWMKEKQTTMSMEFRVQGKQGGTFWVEQTTHFEFDKDGKFVRATNVLKNIDERKQAEEMLRQSETSYRGIIDAMAESVYIQDETGTFIDVNKGAERMYGYTREELIGKTPALVSAEGRNDVARVMEQVQKAYEGTPQEFEFWGKRKNGQIFPKEVHLYPGSYFGRRVIIAIAQDITERKHAEQALKTSEALFRAVVENSHEGIVLLGADRRILYASQSYASIIGYAPEELIGMHGRDLTAPDDRPSVAAGFEQVMRNPEKAFTLQYRIHHKNGSWIWVEATATNFIDNPHLKAVVVNCRDITEARLAEAEIKEAEERYRSLFMQATDGILILDEDGRIIDANECFAKMHGYTREELSSLRINDLDKPETRQHFPERMARIMAGEILQFEVEHLHKDGHVFPLDVAVSKIKINDGNYVLAFHRDTSERKMADENRKHLEQQLFQAQKMESIGTLAAGIAHDFNNILNIILANAGMMDHETDDPQKIRQRAATIMKTSDRGAELVKQVLAFARKSDIDLRVVEINTLIRDLAKLISGTFPKTIDISLDLDPHLPAIYADSNQIHQVVLNLSVNSRDAMPAGGKLRITTKSARGADLPRRFSAAHATQYVEVGVEDNGEGMDEATRKRIFEPFFTTKEVGKGSGLGLAVAYGILEKHNGFIDVRSEVGKGTRFCFYLPATEKPLSPAEEPRVHEKEIIGGNETILFIEDEELLRDMATAYFQNRGYAVLTASDGEEGLAVFAQHEGNISIVLSDQGLPKITGEEVYRRIRQSHPHIPFILLTGFIEPEKKTELLQEGIRSVIQKPYRPKDVHLKMREVLDAKKQTN